MIALFQNHFKQVPNDFHKKKSPPGSLIPAASFL